MKAMIIDEPWISLILEGRKTWEMRKTSCKIRGPIALIRKGSGRVVGTARLVQSRSRLETRAAYAAAESFHRIPADRQERAFLDGWQVPWELTDARSLTPPIDYRHPNGAVIWVNLDPETAARVTAQLR